MKSLFSGRDTNTRAWIKWALLLGAASLFILSLMLPAARVSDGTDWPGFMLFAIGWIGLGAAIPAWLANIAWVAAAVLIGLNWRGSLWLVILGWLLAGTAIPGFDMMGANEASGGVAHVTVGFWVWMLSPTPLLFAEKYRAPNTTSVTA